MTWAAIAVGGTTLAGTVASSLLSKGPKGPEQVPLMPLTSYQNQARRYWQDQLRRAAGIQSGAIPITTDPEFKAQAGQFNSQSFKGLQQVLQMLGKKGITGGAAGQPITQMKTDQNTGLLKLIQDIMRQSETKGAQAANALKTNWAIPTQLYNEPYQQQPAPDTSGIFKALFAALSKSAAPITGTGAAPGYNDTSLYGGWNPYGLD